MTKVNIEDVSNGEFIKRKENAKTTYIKGGYCRYNKAYQIDNCEDISKDIYLKKGTSVFIDFTY